MSGFKPKILSELAVSGEETVGESIDLNVVDVQKSEKLKEEARRKAIRALNALKIINPLLCTIIDSSITDGDDSQSSSKFKVMIGNCSDLSEQLLKSLGVDPYDSKNLWMRNSFERFFADLIKESAPKGKSIDIVQIKKMMSIVLKECASGNLGEGLVFEEESADVHLKNKIVMASSQLIQRLSLSFDFFRKDVDKDIEKIIAHIIKEAHKYSKELSDKNSQKKDQYQVLGMLIQEGVEMYVSAWRAVGKRAADRLSKLSDKELTKFLQGHPDGLPIDEVFSLFDKNFSRLVVLSKKLLPERAGNISVRLKSKQ